MPDPLNVAVGGINTASARIATAAQNIARASVPESKVDIAAETVLLLAAKTEHAANAAVVKTVKKNNDALLDVIA